MVPRRRPRGWRWFLGSLDASLFPSGGKTDVGKRHQAGRKLAVEGRSAPTDLPCVGKGE